jgi:hypothetical protein
MGRQSRHGAVLITVVPIPGWVTPDKTRRRVPPPRGLDFFIRWSQGAWAEERVIEAINQDPSLSAFHYGRSRGDPKSFEQFKVEWEAYQKAQARMGKRPDVLVFDRITLPEMEARVQGGLEKMIQLPDVELLGVPDRSVCGIEVETSFWKALTAESKGLPLSFTLKDEDVSGIRQWIRTTKRHILMVQVFLDSAWAIDLGPVIEDVGSGKIKAQVDYKTRKATFKIPLRKGVPFGKLEEAPVPRLRVLETDRGQILPFPIFEAGRFILTEEMRDLLMSLSSLA